MIQGLPMKIMVVHDPYKPVVKGSVGGEDNLADLEVSQLNSYGHNVLDFRIIDRGFTKKVNQLRAQSFGSTPDLLTEINSFKPDLIHTHNLNQRSGYRWMNYVRQPIVSSLHNFRVFCSSSIAWRNGEICTKCLKGTKFNAIAYGCGGTVGAINATRHLFWQKDQPQVIKPKLFLVASEIMKKTLEPIISENKMKILRNPSLEWIGKNSDQERKGWLFAGRLVPEKGIIKLIENWPENENLDIAGDGPLINEVKQIIADKINIRLIGTYPPGDNSIFTKYEGLMFPSSWLEGSPLVVIDSLSTGTPVICTDQSAAKEQIEITGGGVVIKGGLSKEKISDAQLRIRKDFTIFSELGSKAVRNDFSIRKWVNDLELYFSEALA
jgi:glycosyltransferase involved in cell wall biosynthesis